MVGREGHLCANRAALVTSRCAWWSNDVIGGFNRVVASLLHACENAAAPKS